MAWAYDPAEPLTVASGDVIGARNVVDNLITLLGGRRSPISINAFHTELILRTVASGAGANGSLEDISKFATAEDAIEWLIGFRDRLGACLPWPSTRDDADGSGV